MFSLDLLSPASISTSVAAVAEETGGALNMLMLINNSCGGYSMPLMDADLDASCQLFEPKRLGRARSPSGLCPAAVKI